MSPAEILETLRALPHFRAVEDAALLQDLAACCRTADLRAGEMLFRQGERCRGFHVVRRGGVRLFRIGRDGREQVVVQVRAGQSFAEAALLSVGVYPVWAQATATPTEVIEVRGEGFLRLFREREELPKAMVGSLCQRLLELVGKVESLGGAGAEARLAGYLLGLEGDRPRPEVHLTGTKRDLALELGLAPETLSRLLRRFRERGWIEERGRGRIALVDPDALLRAADGEESPIA